MTADPTPRPAYPPFTLTWSHGAYRVSVPNFLEEGERLEVRPTKVSEEELDEMAHILHVFGCVKDCKDNPSGWRENAKLLLEVLGMTS